MISPQENVSPFDVNMACDAGYDLVIPYTNVNLTDVKALVQDAIFSRSVSNAKNRCFYLWKRCVLSIRHDGYSKSNGTPFEISVFPDPADLLQQLQCVACTEKTLKEKFKQIFKIKILLCMEVKDSWWNSAIMVCSTWCKMYNRWLRRH